jgi:hypothetical protein
VLSPVGYGPIALLVQRVGSDAVSDRGRSSEALGRGIVLWDTGVCTAWSVCAPLPWNRSLCGFPPCMRAGSLASCDAIKTPGPGFDPGYTESYAVWPAPAAPPLDPFRLSQSSWGGFRSRLALRSRVVLTH